MATTGDGGTVALSGRCKMRKDASTASLSANADWPFFYQNLPEKRWRAIQVDSPQISRR
jgi:hypothetical protein